MGAPRFGWEEIPLAYALDTTALPVGWEMLEGAAAINVGNPHLVFFVPDLDDVPLERLGPQIETDPLFPNRINVNVAQIIDKGQIGRAHVCTPVTNAQLVCRTMLEKNKHNRR